MKKPKKPSQPKKPIEPKKPSKTLIWNSTFYASIDNGVTLEDFEKIAKEFGCTAEEIFLDVNLEYDSWVCSGGEYIDAKWRGPQKEIPNKNYEKELERYNKKMITYQNKYKVYEEKLKEYKTKLKQYHKDMKEYQIECDEAEIERLQKRLARLQK